MFFMTHGRDPLTPLDLQFQPAGTGHATLDDWMNRMLLAQRQWRAAQPDRAAAMKSRYDVKQHNVDYSVGDSVVVHFPGAQGISKKLTKLWTRPVKVVQKLSDVSYRVKGDDNEYEGIVHVQRLLKVPPRSSPDNAPSVEPEDDFVAPAPLADDHKHDADESPSEDPVLKE